MYDEQIELIAAALALVDDKCTFWIMCDECSSARTGCKDCPVLRLEAAAEAYRE